MELKFQPKEKVWLMFGNKPVCAPIYEIRLNTKVEYYFWHQDFPAKDKTVCYDNTFRVDVNNLFATKQELLNSL